MKRIATTGETKFVTATKTPVNIFSKTEPLQVKKIIPTSMARKMISARRELCYMPTDDGQNEPAR